MKKKTNKNKINIIFFLLFMILFLGVNIVYAKTSSKISFCDYGGVRRTFKILGIFITIIKIVAPLMLIGAGMISVFKTVTSGKADDLKTSLVQLVKQGIAGLIIFCLPGLMDFVFNYLAPEHGQSGFSACTTCLFNTGSCTIPDKEPSTYNE